MLQRKVLTLVFVRRPGELLLGYKKRGFGAARFNGFGGKVESGETAVQGAIRELEEEACIIATEVELRGRLYFEFVDDEMLLDVHVFEATAWSGEPAETDEMRPQWFAGDKIPFDNMWADDRIWLPTFLQGNLFSCYCIFQGETTILESILKPELLSAWDFYEKWKDAPAWRKLLPGL